MEIFSAKPAQAACRLHQRRERFGRKAGKAMAWLCALLLAAPSAAAGEAGTAASADQPGVRLQLNPPPLLAAALEPGLRPPPPEKSPLLPEEMRKRTWLVLGGGLLGIAAFGAQAGWADNLTSRFGTKSEGWFGQRTYAGGADKLGHAFAGHVGTRLFTAGLQWAGHSPEDALRLGALTTFGVLLGVELLDGFERKHQFNWQDLIADAAGVGLGMLLEKRPDLDALIDFRMQYWPSDAERRARPVQTVNGDYDGYTWLLAFKASGVPALREHPVLRYLELSVGYGTVGYGTADGVEQFGSRHVYYGISLNLSELLNTTVFRDTPRTAPVRRASEMALEYIQVPGTALFADHRLAR